MNALLRLLPVAATLLLGACTTIPDAPENPAEGTHLAFRSTPGWQERTYFVDEEEMPLTTPENSRVVIILGEQRALLLRDSGTEGEPAQVVVDTQVATGLPGHSTPAGEYSIISKKRMHRSNLYGVFLDADGNVVDGDAEARNESPPPGGSFLGAAMPYWQRLTNTGIGMHVGNVPGQRTASHGCIRFPSDIMPRLYERTKVGTPVSIVQSYAFPHYPQELLTAGLAEPVVAADDEVAVEGEGGSLEDEENEEVEDDSGRRRGFLW